MTEAQALLRLQEIDLDMLRMASTLAAMPQQKKMQAIARARRKVQREQTKIFAQRKDLETFVAENQEDLEHYRARTERSRPRSHREATAIVRSRTTRRTSRGLPRKSRSSSTPARSSTRTSRRSSAPRAMPSSRLSASTRRRPHRRSRLRRTAPRLGARSSSSTRSARAWPRRSLPST